MPHLLKKVAANKGILLKLKKITNFTNPNQSRKCIYGTRKIFLKEEKNCVLSYIKQ